MRRGRPIERFCAGVLLAAMAVRLLGGMQTLSVFASPRWDPMGLWNRTDSIRRPALGTARPPTEPEQPQQPPAAVPVFSGREADSLRILYDQYCTYRPDIETLLQQPLQLRLQQKTPTVLIVHSHATESYTQAFGEDFDTYTDYRSLDTDHNLVAVGDALARALEQMGIQVVHDRTLHDYPSYNEAYIRSRQTIAQYLQAYPTIQLVLDLHRDAALNADGSQYAASVSIDGEKTAQLLLVMGTDEYSDHPNWQENLALAVKLQALLEDIAPGVTRGTVLRSGRFNQDLSPGTLLVEFGAAGNTLAEALRAVPILAEAILALANGAN